MKKKKSWWNWIGGGTLLGKHPISYDDYQLGRTDKVVTVFSTPDTHFRLPKRARSIKEFGGIPGVKRVKYNF